MTDAENLHELTAIRERLRALEERLRRHEEESRLRSDKHDVALHELAKTVAALSTSIATISVRMTMPTQAPLAGPIAAGSGLAGGLIAAATYLITKTFGG